MSKHTPGKWEVFSNELGVGVTSIHADVAWVEHKGGGLYNSDRSAEEVLANAELIAAAPDMASRIEELQLELRVQKGVTDSYARVAERRLDTIKELTAHIQAIRSVVDKPL